MRATLARCSRRIGWPPGAAVVAPQRLHLTLHFIGPVGLEGVAALAQGLSVPVQPFELRFERCASWPRGLVVLEAAAVPDALRTLHASLAVALGALELPVERRPFNAHVTLARRAVGAKLPPVIAPVRWRVDGYALVRSHLGTDARYEVLWRHRAGGAPTSVA